ncbi:hypothetical protein AX16_009228 [Volvariella volvacea WC 439]|nr:hypothetical protein AX16_009228 [Volvariella volvacea WC 439]
MASLTNLSSTAKYLAKFAHRCAEAAGTKSVVAGASALLVRNVIERTTEDVDVYILPGTAKSYVNEVEKHFKRNDEKVTFPGAGRKTEREIPSTFKYFKVNEEAIEPPQWNKNMKTDISEQEFLIGAREEHIFSYVEGIRIATVELVTVLKVCLRYLRGQHCTIPQELLALIEEASQGEFSWTGFWAVAEAEGGLDLKESLEKVGILKIIRVQE